MHLVKAQKRGDDASATAHQRWLFVHCRECARQAATLLLQWPTHRSVAQCSHAQTIVRKQPACALLTRQCMTCHTIWFSSLYLPSSHTDLPSIASCANPYVTRPTLVRLPWVGVVDTKVIASHHNLETVLATVSVVAWRAYRATGARNAATPADSDRTEIDAIFCWCKRCLHHVVSLAKWQSIAGYCLPVPAERQNGLGCGRSWQKKIYLNDQNNNSAPI